MSDLIDVGVATKLRGLLHETETDDRIVLVLILILSVFYSFSGILWGKPDPYHHVWFEKPQSTGRKDRASKVSVRNIAVKLQDSKKDIVIFWGSQSGTAEGFANRLAKDCKSQFDREALVVDISDYDAESLAQIPDSKLAIFILSTYGDGDPSDNSSPFLRWLATNPVLRLSNLRYATFGLGNSNYKYYNRVIDIVSTALERLGAIAIQEVGKADDANGATEDDFARWKQDLFSTFKERLGYVEIPIHYEPMFRVVEDKSLDLIDLNLGEPMKPKTGKAGLTTSSIHPLNIKETKMHFSSRERSCLHVEVDLTGHPELKYTTGDHLAIWPSNPTSEVNRLLSVLQLKDRSSTPLLINTFDPSIPNKTPSPTTLETLFRYYLEICYPLGRETILNLAQFASSPTTKARLLQLGDKNEFLRFCTQAHNTLGSVLESVAAPNESWSALPLSFILETLPCLAPRYYSISSSSIVQPRCIAITVSASSVNEKHEPVPGIMTNYLLDLGRHINNKSISTSTQPHTPPLYDLSGPNNLLESHRVFAQICKSKFRLPVLAQHPIIMVASGSGIAPFRGFLQERVRLASIGRNVGQSMLFFGCRNEEEFLYKQELFEICASGKNGANCSANASPEQKSDVEVITAFSRQSPRKVYVQDRIVEYTETVCKLLLEKDASLYVCGSARMARDVSQTLGECLKERMGWDEGILKEWSERMKKDRRWQEDVWK